MARQNVRRLTSSGASQKAVKVVGQPGEPTAKLNWAPLRRPMRPIRSVTTLIKKDQADGKTMPEFKNTLMRAGVGVRQRAITVMHQHPVVPPRPGANTRVVSPPSPTNRGGVRNPFTQRRVRVRRAKT